jgi:uncharacterized protein (DUF2147 family)
MRRLLFLIINLLLIQTLIKAQGDDICGYWVTLKGNTQIQIFKTSNGKFYGKVVWLRYQKNRLDIKNPDANLRSRTILGLQIINNFVYNSESKIWEKGTIYDPENGKTYSCNISFDGKRKDILKLKGFVLGMKFLGREAIWIRESILKK